MSDSAPVAAPAAPAVTSAPAPPPVGDRKAGKRDAVEQMFDSIAARYDLLNRILSFGIDRLWRRRAIGWIAGDHPRRILDVATGTGDLALDALRLDPEQVVGVDLSEGMLAKGRVKVMQRGEANRIVLQQADAEHLPFEDGVARDGSGTGTPGFDAALVAFGVRNFEDLNAGLGEIGRVLRPGAPLVVLEFSQPTRFPFKQLYEAYSRLVLPRVGSAISGNRGAYEYLQASAAVFPSGEAFLERMRQSGFERVEARPQTFGVATLYKGYRPA